MQEQLPEANKFSSEYIFATFISYIFHPLLMPTYGFMLLFFSTNSISVFMPLYNKLILLGITFLFTFILPAVNTLILLMMGRIKNMQLETSRERVIPYTGALLYYLALCYMFYTRQMPILFSAMVLGAALCILFTLLINNKWKISAHAVGIGGTAGVILGMIYKLEMDLNNIFILSLLCAGIVGYARLRLKAHTPAQVYAGLLLGAVVELLVMFILFR